MFFLIDEFFNQKNKVVEVTFGKPISYEMFSTKKTSKYWANYVKKVTYSLAR